MTGVRGKVALRDRVPGSPAYPYRGVKRPISRMIPSIGVKTLPRKLMITISPDAIPAAFSPLKIRHIARP
jgi:hypothetical protein